VLAAGRTGKTPLQTRTIASKTMPYPQGKKPCPLHPWWWRAIILYGRTETSVLRTQCWAALTAN